MGTKEKTVGTWLLGVVLVARGSLGVGEGGSVQPSSTWREMDQGLSHGGPAYKRECIFAVMFPVLSCRVRIPYFSITFADVHSL